MRIAVAALLVAPLFADVGYSGRTRMSVQLAPGVRMEFVWIKAGTFLMGSPATEKNHNELERQRTITLRRGYWMQTTEVTQAQWQAVMGGNPSQNKGDDLPVEMVSWANCHDFLRALKSRFGSRLGGLTAALPTEAQWEYACRAGSTGAYCSGNDEREVAEYGWHTRNSGGRTNPVGRIKPNAWGLYDIHGNVTEWCEDWYGPYPEESVDPQGPKTGSIKVLRGGAFSYDVTSLRCAMRDGYSGEGSLNFVGFRAVLK